MWHVGGGVDELEMLARCVPEIAGEFGLSEVLGCVSSDDDEHVATVQGPATGMHDVAAEVRSRQTREGGFETGTQVLPAFAKFGSSQRLDSEFVSTLESDWLTAQRFQDVLFSIPERVEDENGNAVRRRCWWCPVQPFAIDGFSEVDEAVQ